nr:hypothetical protein [Tanacetum cinerariifolium]
MVAILEKNEHNVDFHPIVDFIEASPLRYALTFKPTVYVSHIRQFWSTARIKTTEEGTKILATIDKYVAAARCCGQVLWIQNQLLDYGHYTRRARIAQSSALPPVPDEHASPLRDVSQALPPVPDEHASPLRDVSQGEACPTDSGFEADQDRANIAKTSTLPSDSAPRVTSLAADEGSMQQKLNELTALCTSLQRQHSEMVSRIKLLEDKDRGVVDQSGDNAPIKGRRLDEGDEVVERVSDDTEEMATVLTFMDAATVLSSRVFEVPTGSGFIPTADPTGSDAVPTAGLIFATVTVVTPYTRRKGKEKMIESETSKKKKIQEQMDIQMARQLEKEMEREAQRMNEQIARDAEIARIHAEEELQIMIDGLDRMWKKIHDFILIGSKEEVERFKRKRIRFEQESVKKLKTSEENLMHALVEWKLYDTCGVHHVTKVYPLSKGLAIVMISYKLQVENYSQMVFPLPVMEFPLPEEVPTVSEKSSHWQKKRDATAKKIALLLNGSIPTASTPAESLVPTSSKEVPTASPVFATATMVTPVTRRKGKEVMVEGMTFEEVEAKFNSVWNQMEDFIPMGSKEEAERIKRKGINLEQESAKKQKTSEEVTEEAKPPEEVTKEKVYHEGQRSYWKITRLGSSSTSYQFFIDLLKHLDMEDLNQLWRLVEETLSNRPPTSDKEMEL